MDIKASDGLWINDDPNVKEFVRLAKQYYTGAVKFVKNGRQFYSAKLDPAKLKIKDCKCNEAYFDINRTKCRNKNLKEVFFLRMIEGDSIINITIM